MSNYNNLKTSIDANIKQNGNQEITGPILNSVLNQMVNILGTGYQFAGVATLDPATEPGTPDAKVFYIANGKGTYTNFGGIEVTEDEVVVLYWDTAWHKVATGIASQAKLTELEQKTTEIDSRTDGISKGEIETEEDSISIEDNNGNKVFHLDENGLDAKNVKSNGKEVLTEHQDISGKQDVIPQISQESNAEHDSIEIKDDEGNTIVVITKEGIEAKGLRKRIDIYTTDDEITILNKMIKADALGNVDVYWEHGTYIVEDMYLYMRDTLGWCDTSMSRNKLAFPIGHNNRYFFNNSKILATQPSSLAYSVDVFATRTINGNCELYDVEIVNNGGQYCIHDEGEGYEQHYLHKYNNITMKCNGAVQCFGCGVGFNASIILDGCILLSNKEGVIMAVHGVINNPNNRPIYTHISIKDCYMEKYLRFNKDYFDGSRDDLFLYVCNCSMRADDDSSYRWQVDPNFNIIEFNNNIRN